MEIKDAATAEEYCMDWRNPTTYSRRYYIESALHTQLSIIGYKRGSTQRGLHSKEDIQGHIDAASILYDEMMMIVRQQQRCEA